VGFFQVTNKIAEDKEQEEYKQEQKEDDEQ
jgi:hypothetical protein